MMATYSSRIFCRYKLINEKQAEPKDKKNQDQEEDESPVAGCRYSFSLGIHNITSQLLFLAVSQ